jgi:hypothetical protein
MPRPDPNASVDVDAVVLHAQQVGRSRQRCAELVQWYGKALLASLSARLMADYGDGFSVSALKYMRLLCGVPELLPMQSARTRQTMPGPREASPGSTWVSHEQVTADKG